MEVNNKTFWWLKPGNVLNKEDSTNHKLDLNSTSSVSEIEDNNSNLDANVDIGSIIEEINRVAAQSPLGPYEKSLGDRSVDDLMKEAEKIYYESSKSFEQLSQRSKTSQNLSELLSNLSRDSTPTPKSVSPLPMDPIPQDLSMSDDDYTEDFSEESKIESPSNIIFKPVDLINNKEDNIIQFDNKENIDTKKSSRNDISNQSVLNLSKSQSLNIINSVTSPSKGLVKSQSELCSLENNARKPITPQYEQLEENQEIEMKQTLVENLVKTNEDLKLELQQIKLELQKSQITLEKTKAVSSKATSLQTNQKLERVLEDLKDSREKNTSLQLQLDTVNKSHQLLKSSYDDLLQSNKNLERRVIELDSSLDKYKNEILTLQQLKDKLIENEANLHKLLEMEKQQNKNVKVQNEKDSKCIQDLNRQIKEMERIIARKHPDSVSALIVAAKENTTDTSLTARKILEDRIKSLEQEQQLRETQSSKVFMDIQEKFGQVKAKYENHIEDLELHVKDLKQQLKRRVDTFDVYTQTVTDDKTIPQKETFTIFTQTDPPVPSKTHKIAAPKKHEKPEDIHLIATIRGLQTDLSNKEKTINKLHKEIDDLKKTNRKLQKEREGSLKNLVDKKEWKSFPDKLSLQVRSNSCSSEKDFQKEEKLANLRSDRDNLKLQLNKLQDDYHNLQERRIQDLTALQEAHEQEMANYVAGISPLREQLDIHKTSITTLQSQLASTKEELALLRIERDQLGNKLDNSADAEGNKSIIQKIGYLEKQYIDRECRLRAMIQNLAQKNVDNRNCEQCSERQQQLISYKQELDKIIPSLQALQ
ncbi:unnamed protein product [Phyllotreta striolata]|uniref:Centrosomal protein of 162 kDa n=1 Tax=Phyllotreta striolata TaxID=444603 RepID=A0A9N9U1T2_PHYSR|nr:unnamed protein product [Phyllotreta striolata]